MSEIHDARRMRDGATPRVFDEPQSETKIAVLVVDDDPDLLDLTVTFLEKERDEFTVVRTQLVEEAYELLDDRQIDAIVSDFDMPRTDGLQFLQGVRERHGELPFILFTAKGSEEIASEAISEGVTDYLQKRSGLSQYSLLANRLVNAVEQHEATKQLERSQEKFSKLVTNSSDILGIVNENGEFEYISPACEAMLGYRQEEIVGESAFGFMPPADRTDAMEEFFAALEDPTREPTIEHEFRTKDGGTVHVETRGANMFDDELINGFVVNGRDVSELKERERHLEQQNEQLQSMQETLSHDVRNPLEIALTSLSLYRQSEDEAYLEKLETALERIDALVDRTLSMTEYDLEPTAKETLQLQAVAEQAWRMVETDGATLQIDDSRQVEADPSLLQQAFENLFRNAVEHGSTSPPSQTQEDAVEHSSTSHADADASADAVEHSSTSPGSQARRDAGRASSSEPSVAGAPEDAVEHSSTSHADADASADAVEHGSTTDRSEGVTITVGTTERGFYVEDDGPGIPEPEREVVFRSGYTTASGNTGFGLHIVRQVVVGHGWDIDVTEGTDGGARFEVSGVTFLPTVYE